MQTGFFEACNSGNIDLVNEYIKNGVESYVESYDVINVWNYGLSSACRGGSRMDSIEDKKRRMDIVNLMIYNGADDFDCGLNGACQGGHLDIIDLMISKSIDTEVIYNWGLQGACEGGHRDIIDLMISKGANSFNDGLDYASYMGHEDIVNFMIVNGATNYRNYDLINFKKSKESVLTNLNENLIRYVLFKF